MKKNLLSIAVMRALGLASMSVLLPAQVVAQNAQEENLEEVVVTGSRITEPGTVSASPIFSLGEQEMSFQQEPEIEKILRTLPSTIPGDGGNVNNGTDGAATIDLRGLGPERNLVLMDGKRLVPFNYDGEVDTATIPTALVERIDIVTGGASAVYGSDAIAGAVNVIMKKDFEGVEFETSHSQTGDSDGDIDNVSLTIGSNLADGRGNAAISLSWMNRDPVLLGQRPLGVLGIDSGTGSGLDEFNSGQPPIAPVAGCGGPNVVDIDGSGSTTAIPTRFAIVGAGASAGQFREDGTISDECSRFNFNPFNYYQTPAERYSATALAHFDITDSIEVYTTFNYNNTTVVGQVAPSGTFGAAFDLPLYNPLIGDQARQFMIDAGNDALAAGLLNTPELTNWVDSNNNGVVDSEDSLSVQLRRRTLELGPRTEDFDTNQFQIMFGFRGDLGSDWNFDTSFQYGESNRTTVRDGYTNLTNIQNALETRDGVTCENGDLSCVPIDLFGGFGTITPEAGAYATAIALQQQRYEQIIGTASVSGPVNFIELPTAGRPLAASFGLETRRERGTLEPDECLILAPSSCQGGAGGNLLPISGGYSVDEAFSEAILPIFEGQPFAESMTLEVGYRYSDYDTTGSTDTWKVGVNWRPVDQVLFRVMQQQANRAPNVGEQNSPIVTGLDNAKQDPCSVVNAANITPELEALCISTGMSAAQVGTVQNIISGQVNTFDGSDPARVIQPEEADTSTIGVVWTPDFELFDSFTLSVDYYDIDITDVIEEFSAQEVLNGCYEDGLASECAKIKRVGGDLTVSGSGVELFTTNLNYKRAEGIEVGFNFGFSLDNMGDLEFSGNINKYLTQESKSDDFTPVLDCKGFYGTSCDPISDLRWVQRTTWFWNEFTVSAQWRHIDSVDIEPVESADVFPAFRSIDSYDYVDLFASYTYQENITFSLGVDNVFEEEPPVLGNDVGDTSSNSGNTFPSNYNVLGRTYKAGVKFQF